MKSLSYIFWTQDIQCNWTKYNHYQVQKSRTHAERSMRLIYFWLKQRLWMNYSVEWRRHASIPTALCVYVRAARVCESCDCVCRHYAIGIWCVDVKPTLVCIETDSMWERDKHTWRDGVVLMLSTLYVLQPECAISHVYTDLNARKTKQTVAALFHSWTFGEVF